MAKLSAEYTVESECGSRAFKVSKTGNFFVVSDIIVGEGAAATLVFAMDELHAILQAAGKLIAEKV